MVGAALIPPPRGGRAGRGGERLGAVSQFKSQLLDPEHRAA